MLKKIQEVISEEVRPRIQEHGGDIEVVSFEDGNLKIKLLGSCIGCQESTNTINHFVKKILIEAKLGITDVTLETGVSQDLIDMARKLLSKERVV